MYWVYLVKCNDESLYCGYTKDLTRRVYEHNNSERGAKYTRARRPVVLAYSEQTDSLRVALQREIEIKKMSRKNKLALINNANSEVSDVPDTRTL